MTDDDRRNRRDVLLVFAAALALYVLSMSPVVFWGDSAEFARRALSPELSPIARGYPLHRLLTFVAGRVAGDAALGANFVSALAGAAAVALAHETGRRLSSSRTGGFASAAVLALCPAFWLYAGVAEVYTLHVAFVLAMLLAALGAGTSSRARIAFGLLVALSFLHHRMTAFALPGLALLALLEMRAAGTVRRGTIDVVKGFVPGILPFAVLCAVASRTPPDGTTDRFAWWFRDIFMGGDENAGHLLGAGTRSFLGNAAYVAKWTAYDLPGAALLLAGAGLVRIVRGGGPRLAAFALLLPLHLVFPLRYDWTGDQFSFLIPFLAIAAVLVAPGVEALRPGLRRVAVAACIACPVATACVLAWTPVGAKLLPGITDTARRSLVLPVRAGDTTPRDFARTNLARLPEGALLHTDWGDGQVYLYLQQSEGMRPDVEIRIWYGGRPRFVRGGRAEWLSAMPGTVGGPPAFRRVADQLDDMGGGLHRVRPESPR